MRSLVFSSLLFIAIIFKVNADTSITFRLNTGSAYGRVVSSSGNELLTGGLSIGYFTGTPPSVSSLQSLSADTAWQALISFGYVDLRSLTGGFLFSDFDWSFETNPPASPYASSSAIKGGAYLVPGITNETQLYMAAFNSGDWNLSVNSMGSATFGGTEWGMISRISDPDPNKSWIWKDGRLSNFIFALSLTNADVLVGSLSPDYATDVSVRLAPAPEPSGSTLFVLAAAFFLLHFRLFKTFTNRI